MRPLELTLKGFKGIRSGIGRDSVTIDFRDYRGLIALIGDNGRGKSTILSNMHPYRIMPDRVKKYSPKSFSFYDETYGNDAKKDFTFEIGGCEYRCVIDIDAERRKQEAYLFRKSEEGGWEVYGDTQDGKLDVYDLAADMLVGSPRMFFTSIACSQKAPALSSYTRAEMMDIFAELINVDDLKEKGSNAEAVAAALHLKKSALLTEQARFEAIVKDETLKSDEKEKAEKRLLSLAGEISVTEGRLKALETHLRELEVKQSVQLEAMKGAEKLAADISAKEAKVKDIARVISEKKALYNEKFKAKKNQQVAAQDLVRKATDLKGKAEEESIKAASLNCMREQIKGYDDKLLELSIRMKEFSSDEGRLKDVEKKLQKIRLDQKHAVETAERDLKRALASAEKLLDVPCAEMEVSRTCKFIKDAVADRESIGKLQGQLSKANEPNPDEAAFAKELTMLRDRTAGKQDIEKEERTVHSLKSSSVKQAAQLEKDLAAIREDLKLLPKAEEAEKALPGLEAELATILKEGKEVIRELDAQEKLLSAEIESLRGDLSKLKADETLEGRIRKQKETIASASMDLDSLRKEDSSLRVSLGALTEGLKLIGAARDQLAKVAADIEALDREISEWKIIEKAMEGIITLEIDDAGPTVTAITNDILHTCYGPRFSVNIKTQDSKVKGDDMKEVFDIIVYDSERDESKSLSVMSGGEETWIQDAVTRGISLFNASREGGKYQSLFSDEKDGRLTEKRRKEFMAVKRKVLEIGGFFCEYFISHTKEIQDMADDVLNLDDFASDQGLRAAAPGMKQETLA